MDYWFHKEKSSTVYCLQTTVSNSRWNPHYDVCCQYLLFACFSTVFVNRFLRLSSGCDTLAWLLAAIMAAEHFTHMFLISFYSELPSWFQVIKEKIRDQSEELVREVRSQVADLCLEVDQTSAKERAKLLRTVDELSRQLERITSSCNVVKDLLGKAAAYDVSTLREDVLYSLETPREILDLPSVPRYVPLLPLEGDPGPTVCAEAYTTPYPYGRCWTY